MRTLLNHGWQFAKVSPDTPFSQVEASAWREITLPHDWLIFQENDLYETGDGLYRRVLEVPEEEAGLVQLLRFDGVYMDCEVTLNGETVCIHRYGYTAFDVDLTGRVCSGDNLLTVRVRHRSPNSRWYSGAGIFRDVTLSVLPACHLVPDGIYATAKQAPDGLWDLHVSAEIAGPDPVQTVAFALTDASGTVLAEASAPAGAEKAEVLFSGLDVHCWELEDPALYHLAVTMNGDTVTQRIGFRQTRFDPDTGFWLNGEHVRLHGVCLHHDLGLLGSAFHEKAARRQLELMREMGVNAIRTSHNPPAAAFLDLCDEMGFLVVDEAFDMWRMSKTEFDYARFFESCEEGDVASWVRRDRNHPCVFMWSVGNEIYDTHADPEAPAITRRLCDWVRSHDPDSHALTTIGSNYMPWEGAQRCAEEIEVVGYNYGEKYYAAHHAAHPDWVIYGSETASMLSSRGVYHFPYHTSILSEEDLQCSALGNSNTSWGATDLGVLLTEDLRNPYSMGQFIWTGIDYIGEPTPYHTRSAYFGQADTALFPKDTFYRYRAAWSGKPTAHIGVTWDWNPGQLIDVPCATNLPKAELFLNGVSLGMREVDRLDPIQCMALWQVPYAPGELMLRCYDEEGNLQAQDLRCTPGDAAALVLEAEDSVLRADGHDITFLSVSAADAAGLPVENAGDRVRVTVSGPAVLIGLDNGDSADPDGYRQDSRCLFGGKLRICVGFANEPGECLVTVHAEGLEPATVRIQCEAAPCPHPAVHAPIRHIELAEPMRLRKLELTVLASTLLSPEQPSVDFALKTFPEAAPAQPVTWRIVNAAGITSPAAMVEAIPGGARVTGLGDGQAYLRATVTNGEDHPRIISQREVTMSGFGAANLDPYEFISAGLYTLHEGDIGAGNEKGIAFARDGESMVGFAHVDFGPVGSDEITLPIFALDAARYEISLWQGDPREGGTLIAVLPYQKPSIWNTYQAETWRLPVRLTGVQTICFSMGNKVHLKGFSFTRLSRADRPLTARDLDNVYGDSFRRTEDTVEDIGNNVTLTFRGVDFRSGGSMRFALEGRTPLPVCSVSLRVTDAEGNTVTSMLSFSRSDDWAWQDFEVNVPAGMCDVSLVFLPGAQFSFRACAFTPISGKTDV